MAYLIDLNCTCCDCSEPLGISTQLMSECIIREEFPGDEVSSDDAEKLLAKQASEPFVRFPLTLDPITMTLYFPLWCPVCRDMKYTAISVDNIQQLSQPISSNN